MWAGKIGCEIAVGVLTGGAGSARIARLFDNDGFLANLRTWQRNPDNNNTDNNNDGDDNDADLCPANSFAAETNVVMANGTLRPISVVREGDLVLATDPETGESGGREVLATLPHTDQLLTFEHKFR